MGTAYRVDWLCGFRILAIALITGLIGAAEPPLAQDELNVSITYVTQGEDRVIPLSLLDTLLLDEGLMGARQAITENQTTGEFLGHNYELKEVVVPEDGDLVASFKEALAAGDRFFILDLHAKQIMALADLPEAKSA